MGDLIIELVFWAVVGIGWKTRSPLLGGVLFGLAGALCGAVVLGLCGYLFRDLAFVGRDAWLEWALLGGALLGYPLGVFGGILIVGKRRGQSGSSWLALLGAVVGTSLAAGLYQGFKLADQQLFDSPLWLDFLVRLAPVVLIPSLVWLGYGLRTTLKGADHLQQLASDHESVRQNRTATTQVGTASDQRSSRVGDGAQSGACPNCDAPNPADSAFCGECGAAYAVLEA